MKLSTKRRTLIVNGALAALVAAGLVIAYLSLFGGASSTANAAGAATVSVGRGTVTASVSASGKVESARAKSLTFAANGTVDDVRVQPGDKVKKGQILATLDADALADALDGASASLEVAKDEDDDGDTAASYANYVKALNAYKAAKRDLADTVLRAPFAGTVTAVNGTVGDSSGSGGGQGQGATGATAEGGAATSTGFIDLVDTAHLRIVGAFTESDVTKLKVGQKASVAFDALPGVSASGKVTIIDPVATTSGNVVQYPVTIALSGLPKEVRLGATATVSVVTGTAENVLTAPTSVITTAGGRSSVTVLENGQRVTRTVRIGLKGDDLTEITSGVQEGARLVRPVAATTGTGPGTGGGRFPGGGGLGGGGGGFGGGFPGGGR